MNLYYVDCVSRQHLDANGVPLSGGYIMATDSQGNTKAMYMDSEGETQYPAKAELDSRGNIHIYVDGDSYTNFYLYDRENNFIDSWDGITTTKGPKGDSFKYSDFTPEQLEALKGPKGDKGDTGATGATGSTGATGASGANGAKMTFADLTDEEIELLRGPAGNDGQDGADGEQGIPGAQGPQGLQGLQGPKGDKGDKGDVGEPLKFSYTVPTHADLDSITNPEVGQVALVSSDESVTPARSGAMYIWQVFESTGSWSYIGTVGGSGGSGSGINSLQFTASKFTINFVDSTKKEVSVPTFNQNTTGNAATASVAEKATKDSSGNVITSTYATKSELTSGLNGKLSGTYATDSSATFAGLAASAANDADGNAIKTTYATKSEVTTGLGGKLNTSWATDVSSSFLGTSMKAVSDADGNDIGDTYATKSEMNTGLGNKLNTSWATTASSSFYGTASKAQRDSNGDYFTTSYFKLSSDNNVSGENTFSGVNTFNSTVFFEDDVSFDSPVTFGAAITAYTNELTVKNTNMDLSNGESRVLVRDGSAGSTAYMRFQYGSSTKRRGLYDSVNGWVVQVDENNKTHFNGDASSVGGKKFVFGNIPSAGSLDSNTIYISGL